MNDRISLGFVDATIMKPMVTKGAVCRDLRVFPAECRARKCSYRSKLVVSLNISLVILKGPVRGVRNMMERSQRDFQLFSHSSFYH